MAYETLVYMLGMRRSGHHAVLNWVMGQLPNPQVSFNNDSLSNTRFGRHLPDAIRRAARSAAINFEDASARKFAAILGDQSSAFWRRCNAVFSVRRHVFVLTLRDPYNLFASRAAHPSFRKRTVSHIGEFLRGWREHARFFLGEPKLPGLVPVNYNRWFISVDYRRELAEQLGVDFSDARLQLVSRRAGGSSFDADRFQGSAQQMEVLARWRMVKHKSAFRRVWGDSETRELVDRIFAPSEIR